LQLTFRQVKAFTDKIHKRKYRDLVIVSKIHGIEGIDFEEEAEVIEEQFEKEEVDEMKKRSMEAIQKRILRNGK